MHPSDVRELLGLESTRVSLETKQPALYGIPIIADERLPPGSPNLIYADGFTDDDEDVPDEPYEDEEYTPTYLEGEGESEAPVDDIPFSPYVSGELSGEFDISVYDVLKGREEE